MSASAKIPIAAVGDSVIIMQQWVVLTQCDGQIWPLAVLWQNRAPPKTDLGRRWFVERLSYTPERWRKPLIAGGLSRVTATHLLVEYPLFPLGDRLFSKQHSDTAWLPHRGSQAVLFW